jgi:deoxyribose-phosphate aldolase
MNTQNQPCLKDLAKMIDHSLLHPTMTDDIVREGCKLALLCDVATVCVKPYSVPLVKQLVTGHDVGICAVVAFPHGNSVTAIKLKEAEEAINQGGIEIDVVANIGKVIQGDWNYVSQEIKLVNELTVSGGATLKVIFENDFLSDEMIVRMCEICNEHQVAFAKTSTGYGFVKQANDMYSYRGATDHHLKLMRKHCNPEVQIKAAGGVRTLEDLLRVRDLGVTRVGATATQAILEEAKSRGYR